MQMKERRELNKKYLAQSGYAKRKLDAFIKWSIATKGYLKYKHLVEQQDKYNIRVL